MMRIVTPDGMKRAFHVHSMNSRFSKPVLNHASVFTGEFRSVSEIVTAPAPAIYYNRCITRDRIGCKARSIQRHCFLVVLVVAVKIVERRKRVQRHPHKLRCRPLVQCCCHLSCQKPESQYSDQIAMHPYSGPFQRPHRRTAFVTLSTLNCICAGRGTEHWLFCLPKQNTAQPKRVT